MCSDSLCAMAQCDPGDFVLMDKILMDEMLIGKIGCDMGREEGWRHTLLSTKVAGDLIEAIDCPMIRHPPIGR